ncbi:quinone oxidoreductase family protein [Sandaracinus amylolyticus]|uniref:quinone oxidoreductase family protein n=1 Tax=Sandaracinus amylolyticus TaxID=927083 RepID=UPI001F2CC8A1|nr:quinone oxidoreductase [Sandaracinus amylolyticus]UJR85568.1 Hypothetical protein I5071_76480 [Sandaracinus amylolyticus]
MKSRTIRIHTPGGPEVLRLETIDVGEPGPGQARVRHTAIGVNFIDTYHRSGLYPMPLPATIGSEAAGVVEAIGPGVTDVRVGDRVGFASGPVGTYCERRLVPADRLIPLPDAISDEVAAASMLKGMTVEYLVQRTFAVQRGQTVLWHAAAGGVGTIASQWLADLGAIVIGTVGSDEKAEQARANGCAHTIVYTREDFVARTREITGGAGVPVVYDSVGRTTIMRSLDCLAPRGLLVSFGNASGKPDPLDLLVLSAKGSLYVTRPSLNAYVASRAELLASAKALFDRIARGAIGAAPTTTFALEDAAEAHRALESRATTGSVILTVS